MNHINFYSNLPYIEKFEDITNKEVYKDVPIDWYLVLTDIKNSTKALEEGKYQDVNFVASSSISTLLNIDKYVELPFVFGGDGGVVLIPEEFKDTASDYLIDSKTFAKEKFNLEMRTVIIPVIDILREKHVIKVAKLKDFSGVLHPIIIGSGLDYAEYLMRNDRKYQLPPYKPKRKANYQGLKCIWQDFHPKKSEVITLLVKANENSINQSFIYKKVIQNVIQIFGSENTRFPIDKKSIKFKINWKKIKYESILHSYNSHKHISISYSKIIFKYFFKTLSLPFTKTNSKPQNHSMISERFDGTLRMILTGDSLQAMRLRNFLEDEYQKKNLAYGIYLSKTAHVTCLVKDNYSRQYFFLDGSDGGYTNASKELKNKLKWLNYGSV